MEQVLDFFERFGEMTFSNEGFWTFAAIAAAVILAYELLMRFAPKTVAPVSRFFDRHPLVWICIPAALLIYCVYVSLGWNLWVSVSDWQAGELEASYGFGGFGNYARMFASDNFLPALKNTLLLFCLIPLCLLLGLGLALVMDQGLRGTAVFRTLILLPFALSFVVTGTVWAYMYRPTGGVLNSFLSILGVDVSAAMKSGHLMWASSNSTIMLSIIIAMVWQFSGYVAVIFLAAIKNVPVNIVNAAKLDGAYMPRIYAKLIIPQLKGAMGELGQPLLTSLFVTLFGAAGSVFMGSICAYALSKWKFKLNNVFFIALVAATYLPFQAILIPLLQTINALDLYDNIWGLVLVHTVFGMPMCTVMMRGYYADIPDALIRQAMIDGNGVWQIYRKIVVPNTKIATITVFVFQCTSIWNEMLFALVLGGYDSKPATIALNELAGTMAAEFNVQMAGSLILALPVLVLYIFMGKYLISGQMSGAVTAS